jgi:signal transduction histidine kinase
MNPSKPATVSLLWRILLSTSVAITLLFLVAGWIVQDQFVRLSASTLEQEARVSFQAYESLWQARADQLASTSLVLSRMPDVRASFSTGDRATIDDTAREVWDRLSRPGTIFLVCDPLGAKIAQVGIPDSAESCPDAKRAAGQFPRQARGFTAYGDLYQIVVTPVYVASSGDPALLNVLVAGVKVDSQLVREMKSLAGGSEFVFFAGDRVVASTLDSSASASLLSQGSARGRIDLTGKEFYQFASSLADVDGHPVGELRILRSFDAANARIAALRARLAILWFAAVLAGLGMTYLLAKRLLRPVNTLDAAAAEIAKGNYDVRVPPGSRDEIGRLAETFNTMCASISAAREDLIRQERISTIGRLSTSIVHDLRNPLAAIYGGAEMLVDTQLSAAQVQRLAGNIYRASRQIQDLLGELADVTQGRNQAPEVCRLREIVQAAMDPLAAAAEAANVTIKIDVPEDLECSMARSPMERVFQNLIGNAIEAMPGGGSVHVRAERRNGDVLISVEDTGPGIPEEITGQLFQPFVTFGKKNGVGLGLALSRKTVLTHGGDLWTEPKSRGACFLLRLPVEALPSPPAAPGVAPRPPHAWKFAPPR